MPHAERRVTIRRPVDEVYRYIASGEHQAEWRPAVMSIKLRSGRDGEAGAVYEQKIKGPMGRAVPADYEITSAIPNKELRFRALAGPVRPEGYYLFESSGEGTTVTFGMDCQPSGLARLMTPMVAKAMDGEVACIDNVKSNLER
ncbi:MAG TPA: SRPBCC family protein [Candidatus Elarobacter sp.]|jgi:uncharacterized membrane protein|nr:SRPBCC family protein [Candidatus Elarobacter sp.]